MRTVRLEVANCLANLLISTAPRTIGADVCFMSQPETLKASAKGSSRQAVLVDGLSWMAPAEVVVVAERLLQDA